MNNLDPSIRGVKDEYHIAGEAYTVELAVGDNLHLLKAMKEAKPGDILVVDVKGDTYRAIAGDFVVGMMKTLGLGGLVVDGVIRDIVDIKGLDFPVFSKGTTVASDSKNGPGGTNIPISCGGASVQPGDSIDGEVNGVVAIPRDQAATVLEKDQEKERKDEEREEKYRKNKETSYEYIQGMLAKSKQVDYHAWKDTKPMY